MVEPTRDDLATSTMLMWRSPNWAMAPFMARDKRFELLTPWSQIKCSTKLSQSRIYGAPGSNRTAFWCLQDNCNSHYTTGALMVDTAGIEPVTPACRAGVFPIKLSAHNGGSEEARSPNPLNANQMLSQLSYTPKK